MKLMPTTSMGCCSLFWVSKISTHTAYATGALSHVVDVYAFGVVLWELYTAQRAWAGMRQAQIVHTVCTLEQQLEFPYGTPQPYEVCSYLLLPSLKRQHKVLLAARCIPVLKSWDTEIPCVI